MTNNTMTVKMWDEITEVQAETLNGGSGKSSNGANFNFTGSNIGFFQYNEGDGVQVNTAAISQGSSVKVGRGYRHH